jgi:hypothetical protein
LKNKSLIVMVLLFTLCFAFIAPAAPVYAFSVADLLPSLSGGTSTATGGGLVNMLLGLLMGKILGNGNDIIGSQSSDTSGTVNGKALVTTAKKYMGVPYVWGGSTTAGFDCSGFTQYVMKQNSITIPRTAAEQYATGTSVAKSNLQIGDLVFFTTYKPGASHVGFYLGNNEFIHASSAANQVAISALDESYYTERYIGARRYTK